MREGSSGCEAGLLSESSMPENAGETLSVPLSLKHTHGGAGGDRDSCKFGWLQLTLDLKEPPHGSFGNYLMSIYFESDECHFQPSPPRIWKKTFLKVHL